MKKVKFSELTDHAAATNGISKAGAQRVVTDALQFAIDELQQGNEVILPGLGRFVPTTQAARTGRNPATGEAMEIPERTVVKFKVAPALKEGIKGVDL